MKAFILQYQTYILFIAIVAVGLTFTFLVLGGYYPIAMVEGTLVSAHTFNVEYAASTRYYQNMVKTYGSQVPTLGTDDIKLLTMENIIENVLVAKAAQKEVGGDLNGLIQNKLSAYSSDASLLQAATGLYGFNKNDLWNLVLMPQAERDILSGRLFLKNQKFDDWLTQAKQSANISLFSGGLKWTPQGVATST